MKKVVLIISLLFTFLLILTTGCSINENVSEIELINLKNGERLVLTGNSEDCKIILQAIKSKENTEDSITNLTSYELLIKKNTQTSYNKLTFDLNNKKAYITKEGKNYKINDNETKKLLLNEKFSYVYIDSMLYDSFLDYNENKIKTDVKYQWTYKDFEGQYVKKEGNINNSINKENIRINENDVLDIAYEKVPDSQVIHAYEGENLVSSGTNLKEVLNKLTSNGEYTLESQAQWLMKDNSDSYGKQVLTFNVTIEKPASIQVITRENYPGNILIVSVKNLGNNETINLKTDAVKVPTEIYTYKGRNIFICPIDLDIEPGAYDLNVVVNEGTNSEYKITSSLEVKNKTFKTQYLTVTEEMNDINNDNTAIYEFVQLVKPARAKSVAEKLWEGTFDIPVEGRLTTDFAEIRYINNEKSSSRHSGLDLAAPLGTEVKAPNNGVVSFAMEGLLSPGNTVVIDHGMGLFTSYYHLDTINVKNGQKVTKGTVIGTVGTTGFSTGPHLHYAVSIYNTYVNPYQTLSGIID